MFIPSTALSFSPTLISWIAFEEPSAIITNVSAMKHPHPTVVSNVHVDDVVTDALHEAFVQPLDQEHVQDQGPFPDTVLAVQFVQRLVDGAVLDECPLADPHVPFTGVLRVHACTAFGLG